MKEIITTLLETYEGRFKSLELDIEHRDGGDYVVYKSVDTYGIKNKSVYKIQEGTTESDIEQWVDTITRNTFNVMRLNNFLDSRNKAFKVNYRYVINKQSKAASYVYAWDYNSIQICLSDKSLHLLDKNVYTLEVIEDYSGYESFAEFISKYLADDYIVNLLGITFESDSIYNVLTTGQYTKKEILDRIHNLRNKSGILGVSSTLISQTLQIICKINWMVNFDTVDISLSFEENKIFSTKDMDFIRDSAILDGLLKLYKPDINDIFV